MFNESEKMGCREVCCRQPAKAIALVFPSLTYTPCAKPVLDMGGLWVTQDLDWRTIVANPSKFKTKIYTLTAFSAPEAEVVGSNAISCHRSL